MSKNVPLTKEDFKSSLSLIVGNNNIIFADDDDSGRLQPYLEESRGRHMGKAFAVVFPSTTDEVAKVVSTCHHHKVPIVPQGGNTGRCLGAQSNDENAVIVHLKHLNRIRDFDAQNMTVTVESGVILQHLLRRLLPYRW